MRRRRGGRGKYFSGNCYIKFGHFVNFSYIFSGKMSCRLKLAESYAYESVRFPLIGGLYTYDFLTVDCRDNSGPIHICKM